MQYEYKISTAARVGFKVGMLPPAGLERLSRAELKGLVVEAQTTVPRPVRLLRSLRIFISERQVVRLLIAGQEGFVREARDVLHAGLFRRPLDHG